jgi:hypothetical protein
MQFMLTIIGVSLCAFWISQLVDLLRREDRDFSSRNDRLIWTLVILLLPILGSVLYFLHKPIWAESSEGLKREWSRIRSSNGT